LSGADGTILEGPGKIEAQELETEVNRGGAAEGLPNRRGRCPLAVGTDTRWTRSMGGLQE
jgi:hypothetical protein